MSDVTSIAAYSTALSNAQLKEQVGYAVMKKSMDASKQQGQAALSLLESAAKVARSSEPGKGASLDVLG